MQAANPLLQSDLVRSFYRDLKAWLSNALLPVIMLIAAYGAIPSDWLVTWAMLALVIFVGRTVLHRAYFRAGSTPRDAERWMRYGVAGALASAALWGLASLIFLFPEARHVHWLLGAIVLGLVGGVTVMSPASLPLFYAYLGLTIGPYLIGVATQSDLTTYALGAVVLVFSITRTVAARSYRQTILDLYQLRRENLELIEALRSDKRQADEARARAEEASAAKSKYLAAASHDLRQPVHALGLFVEELRERAIGTTVPPALVWNIRSAVESVSALLGSVLDISKLDSGVVKPNMVNFRIGELLERVIAQHRPAAMAKGLDLRYRNCSAIVRSDPNLLLHILNNFTGNAVRYTSNGRILIGCRRLTYGVRVEVWDTGRGIPQAEQSAIFYEFHRLDDSGHDSGRGFGLGLAIAERTAKLLRHPLAVRSALGRGSVFCVELPYGDPLPAAVPSVAGGVPMVDITGLVVAVVDDDQAILAGMVGLLRRWGCQVISAPSGDDLLATLHRQGVSPDVLIVDYKLGKGELGPEVIERLSHRLGVTIPSVLITGDLTMASDKLGPAADVTILHKPVRAEHLRHCLAALVGEGTGERQ